MCVCVGGGEKRVGGEGKEREGRYRRERKHLCFKSFPFQMGLQTMWSWISVNSELHC